MNSNNSARTKVLDRLIAYDRGRLTGVETVELFQELINHGSVWYMIGGYGRMAMHLIKTGHCLLAPVQHRDYYGNTVPSRYDLDPGQPGTESFVEAQQVSADELSFDPLD